MAHRLSYNYAFPRHSTPEVAMKTLTPAPRLRFSNRHPAGPARLPCRARLQSERAGWPGHRADPRPTKPCLVTPGVTEHPPLVRASAPGRGGEGALEQCPYGPTPLQINAAAVDLVGLE